MINIQDIIPFMKKEEWKSIYNGKYYVSNYGRVYSSYSQNLLSQFKTPKGYLRVTLWQNGNKKGYLTHRLVAENTQLKGLLKECFVAINEGSYFDQCDILKKIDEVLK